MRADGRGAEARRVQEIDAVASTLPMARCDRLEELLTEADIATKQQGMGENTLRALASKFGYLEACVR